MTQVHDWIILSLQTAVNNKEVRWSKQAHAEYFWVVWIFGCIFALHYLLSLQYSMVIQ